MRARTLVPWLVAVAVLAVCGHSPPPAPVVQTVVVQRGCLTNAGKVQPLRAFAPTPCAFAACFDRPAALALAQYVAALEQRVADDQEDCALATDAGVPDATTTGGDR